MSCRISKISYSIDEVKLMTKVKRYKRRWKEQRHYSEYLKCKLTKKALQVQELKAENAALHARIAELEAERDEARAMVARLIKVGNALQNQAYDAWRKDGTLDFPAAGDWYAIVDEWQEREE